MLISTPRRFGKTISVSMFAAAMLFAAPTVEISIYSTCKRISQKLLRNVSKFFNIICDGDPTRFGFRQKRENMEEIVLQGPVNEDDVRVVNSYPSKVSASNVVRCACAARSMCMRFKSPAVALVPRVGRCTCGRGASRLGSLNARSWQKVRVSRCR